MQYCTDSCPNEQRRTFMTDSMFYFVYQKWTQFKHTDGIYKIYNLTYELPFIKKECNTYFEIRISYIVETTIMYKIRRNSN